MAPWSLKNSKRPAQALHPWRFPPEVCYPVRPSPRFLWALLVPVLLSLGTLTLMYDRQNLSATWLFLCWSLYTGLAYALWRSYKKLYSGDLHWHGGQWQHLTLPGAASSSLQLVHDFQFAMLCRTQQSWIWLEAAHAESSAQWAALRRAVYSNTLSQLES